MRRANNSKLPPTIDRQLNSYAVGASAAGVALLACSLPADARVICRKSSESLLGTQTIPFNPANGQFPPFNLAQTFLYSTPRSHRYYWNRAFLTPNTQGANDLLAANGLPKALAKGDVIGSKGQFGKGNSYGMLFTYGQVGGGTVNHHQGNFPLTKVGYLGFKFSMSGEAHYGWARLRVDVKKPQTTTNLLGFGYETIAGKAVHAGACTTVEESTASDLNTPQASTQYVLPRSDARIAETARRAKMATLGVLARGSMAVASPIH
jgi:hypothetical protein